MKNKRPAALIIFFLVLSTVLGGCSGSLKTAKVATKFEEALFQQPITSAIAEVSCDVTSSDADQLSTTKFRTVIHSRTNWSDNRSYSNIQTTMTQDGDDQVQNMQCYANGESGELVRYLYMDSMDTWFRLENQKRIIDVDPALVMGLLEKVAEETTMEIRENTASGSQHYVLRLCFQGQDLMDFAKASGFHLSPELEQCDLSGLTVPVELEIEDKTFLPIRLYIEVKGVSKPVMNAIEKSFAEVKGLTGSDTRMGDISLLLTGFGYGPQDIPMLPMGAAEKALDMKKIKEMQN